MCENFRILVLGDVVGKPAREFIKKNLKKIIENYNIECVIANCENATMGSGLTKKHAEELHLSGIDLITLGDHVWDRVGFSDEIDGLDYVLRPANLNDFLPGRTFITLKKKGKTIGVSTFLGRQFMKINSNCPFSKFDELVRINRNSVDIMICEIHAEATSEKVAFGWYADGKVELVFGTHTHVQTADEYIMPNGTAYITDIGMCGSHKSVIGRDISAVVSNFITGIPSKFVVAEEAVGLNGILVYFDYDTNKPSKISRIVFN